MSKVSLFDNIEHLFRNGFGLLIDVKCADERTLRILQGDHDVDGAITEMGLVYVSG